MYVEGELKGNALCFVEMSFWGGEDGKQLLCVHAFVSVWVYDLTLCLLVCVCLPVCLL